MRAEAIVGVLVAALFVSSALMTYGGPQGAPVLEVGGSDGAFHVTYSMPSSAHGYQATIVAVPVVECRTDDVYVLMSGQGGRSESAPANIQGLVDHLSAELRNIRSSSRVVLLDEAALGPYLASGNGTLVISSSIEEGMAGAVEAWVREGGVLVAIGPHGIPFNGQEGSLAISFLPFVFNRALEGTTAYDMGLRTVCPSYAPSTADIVASSGSLLGYASGDGASNTMGVVPLGLGRVLVMGGPIEPPFLASMEDVFAWDLARCLEAGVQWAAGPVLVEGLNVPSEGLEGSFAPSAPGMGVKVSIYSQDDAHALFSSVLVRA